ncbi:MULTISPECIES: hypothetical protein [Okeania]|uniref:hypothetical protein n=1 Tax=Okeania TaxID=1458928 RepID=UPI000F540A45|nr:MULTISPECIES: hypothetical protein [Okeania]NEP07898.1 hypothetical protein [Okeania sp. SIO4D6]NEP38169.1 hypothetical protein [Okeania sp. SIO2H7]NEP72770.1 hypothetical protein [Okeania sp. SIO2G5]NEP93460.1 hypothetical protein [Okeania sp. SIO2F5]NEQ89757.1 hypothetical protein [Okeania sp. SIO2G4]
MVYRNENRCKDGEMGRWGYQEKFGNGAVMEHFFRPNPSGFDLTARGAADASGHCVLAFSGS